MRTGQRALFAAAVLGMAFGALVGCETTKQAHVRPTIMTEDLELVLEIPRFLDKLSPEDWATIQNEILSRKDLFIHVIQGDLSKENSRGGASSRAVSEFSKRYCKKHPKVEDVPWTRDWDLVVDLRVAGLWAKKCGIPNPPDAVLYHEIFGHILWLLRRPEFLKANKASDQRNDRLENEARIIENKYRAYRVMQQVPQYMEHCYP